MATTQKRAQAKRQTRKRAATTKAAGTSATFVCPECGRTFARAAALGAHRSRAHGVAGQSAQSVKRRSTKARVARRPTRATRTSAVSDRNGIDRDALLKTLFPDGMSASEELMRAATDWLDEAERLSKLR